MTTNHTPSQRARELLAAEYERRGAPTYVAGILNASGQYDTWPEVCALRAIDRALGEADILASQVDREAAWRDGFECARRCLSDDEAFCLTEDVEDDAWVDSDTKTLLNTQRGDRK